MQEMIRGIGLVDKQTGGKGQYAKVEIEIEAKDRGAGVEIVNAVVGGEIPKDFIPAIETGIRGVVNSGVLAGYPLTDVLVRIVGGKFHAVDSSAHAFQEAGRLALIHACAGADMALLEPIGSLEVEVPTEYLGAINGDIARRRGSVIDLNVKGNSAVITARIPIAETLGYSTDLRSLTQGRGTFTLAPAGYEETPSHIQENVLSHK